MSLSTSTGDVAMSAAAAAAGVLARVLRWRPGRTRKPTRLNRLGDPARIPGEIDLDLRPDPADRYREVQVRPDRDHP